MFVPEHAWFQWWMKSLVSEHCNIAEYLVAFCLSVIALIFLIDWGLVWANFLPWALDRWNAFTALGTWSLDNFKILLPTLNFLKCFQKLLFFRKYLLSDFWGIKAILKLLYRFLNPTDLDPIKKPTDLDPTDLGLVFDILKPYPATCFRPLPRVSNLVKYSNYFNFWLGQTPT